MSKQSTITPITINPKLDFAIERFIDAPTGSSGKRDETGAPQGVVHAQGLGARVANRNGRATGRHLPHRHRNGRRSGVSQPRMFLDVIPMERLVWTSMLFPGYRPAVFDDIPITAIITKEPVGTGTRYVFTALHRNEADLETNKTSGITRAPRSPSISSWRHVPIPQPAALPRELDGRPTHRSGGNRRRHLGDPLQHHPARDLRRTRLHHHRLTQSVTYVAGHFCYPSSRLFSGALD